ncbi:MAG: porphobilinogen synthase, partial [Vallitaleaceae bacterium]|nr:porphobilinogen synthase [Vallitaleaceae bacterium]
TQLSMKQMIYPIFLVEGSQIKEEIPSMKEQYHYSVDALMEELPRFKELGIRNLLIFASTHRKSIDARSGAQDEGVVQRGIREIKKKYPEFLLIADVCLCQYKEDGHCCIYHENHQINRKETLKVLGEIATSYARAGADMVAPSDMMDGRVAAIREALDQEGYEQVSIMAYSAKYASAFYGPFREAAHSAPAFGDRKMYQMDPANRREAIKEVELDLFEGADLVMIKPAMAYLDVISDIKAATKVPVVAYQVSGEYVMLRDAVRNQVFDERAIYESLLAIKRSGADIIISYFTPMVMRLLEEYQC